MHLTAAEILCARVAPLGSKGDADIEAASNGSSLRCRRYFKLDDCYLNSKGMPKLRLLTVVVPFVERDAL